MPCTADAAASRSRASRRHRGHRTRAPDGSLAPPPDDEASTEAHPPPRDAFDPGSPPELEQRGLREPRVEVPDRRAEEAPDLVPARRDEASREWQADPDPGVPRKERDPARQS